MRLNLVIYVLGWILIAYSCAMLPAILIAWIYGTGGGGHIFLSLLLTLIVGFTMRYYRPETTTDITPREGFLIVTGGWFLCSGFGALPFFIDETFMMESDTLTFINVLCSLTDSVFESTSGLTTTGASVLTDFNQPHAIMFWRSTNHWLGGMGIIVLSLAILPLIGAGGMQLFKAEVPGPVKDRLKPRIADTAKTLSTVYFLLTMLETFALMFCGMNWYEALCHTFGTVATGGFSTHPLSVGGYESTAINLVITVFMILAGANFVLHYRFLNREFHSYQKNGEFRTYIMLLLTSVIILTVVVWINGNEEGFWNCFEHSLFQAVSIMTTTGYCTSDFETWFPLAGMILFFLMFVGGCAGSTGGGIKVIRFVLLAKIAYREMVRLLFPTSVVVIKQDGEAVPERVNAGITGFAILAATLFIVSTLFLSAFGLDFTTAMTATAACMFNIGPGLGDVGPYDNYAGLPIILKWWLSFCMIVGRLELYSVLILTAPNFWRK